WGPVMAFLTSSPLMSPDGFVVIAGVLNLRFAIVLTVASVMIGLGSGFVTHIIEKRTTYLKNQTRFAGKAEVKACGCGEGARETANTVLSAEKTCGCGTQTDKKEQKQRYKSAKTAVYRKKESKPQSVLEPVLCCASGMALSSSGLGTYARRKASSSKSLFDKSKSFLSAIKWKELLKGCYEIGVKQIILYFAIFVGIGSLINMLVPSSIIGALLGAHNIGAVPLATLIGLPLYITTDSAIPIIKSLIQSGASEGAMMAFMIAGSATSAWVIAGISAFLKKRAIALYLAFIIVGAIISGYVYDLVLTVL
ncbi:MAG: permease, partial [Clostridia bacterium]|nr:permease [Clostridia bacterium]